MRPCAPLGTAVCLFLLFAFVWPGDAGGSRTRDGTGRSVFQEGTCQSDEAVPPQDGEPVEGTAPPRHFLWKAALGQGVLYLFGSIHFGKRDWYPLHREIMESYAESDVLVVEADLSKDDPALIANVIADKGLYPDGGGLRGKVGEKTWRDLLASAKNLGAPAQLFAHQKPWLAALTLVNLSMNRIGFSEDLGVDRYFLQRAEGKAIVELESLQQQLQMLDGMSESEQLYFLTQTLRDIERGGDLVDAMVAAWRRGDAECFDRIVKAGFDDRAGGREFYASMFIERNRAMTERLVSLAQDGRTYFVVVGAGHLTGKDGIVALLERRGFPTSQR